MPDVIIIWFLSTLIIYICIFFVQMLQFVAAVAVLLLGVRVVTSTVVPSSSQPILPALQGKCMFTCFKMCKTGWQSLAFEIRSCDEWHLLSESGVNIFVNILCQYLLRWRLYQYLITKGELNKLNVKRF